MNRRTAVKNLALVVGAATLLPACLPDAKEEAKASIPLKNLKVSARQEKLLAEVCETILPRTDTPGAKDLGLHLYVLKMLDDCCPEPEQQAFLAGLTQLDEQADEQFKQSFSACSGAQKLALLQNLAPKSEAPKQASFHSTVRRLTVAGYTQSKYFMTKQVVYELVPSRYNGYFPTKNLDLAKTHHGQS